MNKEEVIAELVKSTSLSISNATKLLDERISMKADEKRRKITETELKLINDILDRYNGVENE